MASLTAAIVVDSGARSDAPSACHGRMGDKGRQASNNTVLARPAPRGIPRSGHTLAQFAGPALVPQRREAESASLVSWAGTREGTVPLAEHTPATDCCSEVSITRNAFACWTKQCRRWRHTGPGSPRLQPRLVLFQVDDQLDRASRQDPFKRVRTRVVSVQPDRLDEPIERRARNPVCELHHYRRLGHTTPCSAFDTGPTPLKRKRWIRAPVYVSVA